MNNLCLNKKSGLTLTEIMLATILLALAILPIVGIFSQGHKMTQKDMRRIEAIHFAESTMNKLLKLPFAQVPVGLKNANLVAASGTVPLGNVTGTGNSAFAISLNVTNFPVSYSYCPVDINDPGYDPDKSETWVFLPPTQEGSVFDGSSKFCPFMVKQYEVTVSWQESNGVTPAPVSLLSLKANLEE